MTKTIAVAGKGGTGKTTITALLIKYLVENKKGSVLAIDADPSTNLNLALGVPLEETVGDIREETLQGVKGGSSLGGMSRPDYLELRVNQALMEEDGFDLLASRRTGLLLRGQQHVARLRRPTFQILRLRGH